MWRCDWPSGVNIDTQSSPTMRGVGAVSGVVLYCRAADLAYIYQTVLSNFGIFARKNDQNGQTLRRAVQNCAEQGSVCMLGQGAYVPRLRTTHYKNARVTMTCNVTAPFIWFIHQRERAATGYAKSVGGTSARSLLGLCEKLVHCFLCLQFQLCWGCQP